MSTLPCAALTVLTRQAKQARETAWTFCTMFQNIMNCCHFIHLQPVRLSVMLLVKIHVELNMHENICNVMMMK